MLYRPLELFSLIVRRMRSKMCQPFIFLFFISLFVIKSANAHSGNKPLRIKEVGDIDGFATMSIFSQLNNGNLGDFSDFRMYYTLNIKNKLSIGKVNITSSIFSETELVIPIDSFAYTTQDLFTIKHNLLVPLGGDHLSLALFRFSRTQLINRYKYNYDSNATPVRILESSYLSPGFVTFGASIALEYDNSRSDVQIIIAGGRRTKVLNQDIYEQQSTNKIAGVEKGQRKTLAYGIGLSNNTRTIKLRKNVFFENSCDIFVPYQQVNSLDAYTFDLNTAFHYNLTKHVRISYRNKIFFDSQVQEMPLITNSVTVGWYADRRF